MIQKQKTERLISLFDLEKKTMAGIECLQHIIEANIKFVPGEVDDLTVLHTMQKLPIREDNRIVHCKKTEYFDKNDLTKYLHKIANIKSIRDIDNIYEILFYTELDADICATCSTDIIEFYKSYVQTDMETILRHKKILHNGIYNRMMPLDYSKIIIGPLETDIRKLAKEINIIAPLFGIEKLHVDNYFGVLFQDPVIAIKFVNTIKDVKITTNKNFQVCFAYNKCLITNLSYWTPFISSYCRTKIVFVLNASITMSQVISICNMCRICDVREGQRVKRLIECEDIDESQKVYKILGGYSYNGVTLVVGFYPEFCYKVGDY